MNAARVPIDWPALMPDVARVLLGEPNARQSNARELRYGTHGSLAVHVGGEHSGTDHEAGAGGGVLDLVMRETGASDTRGAMAWLRDAGLLDGASAGRYQPDSELAGRDAPSKGRYRGDSAPAPRAPGDRSRAIPRAPLAEFGTPRICSRRLSPKPTCTRAMSGTWP